MNLRSIGVRLAIWYAAIFTASTLLFGAAAWFAVERGLYHAIDESLRDRADGIRIFVEDHSDRLLQEEVRQEFRAHGDLFQVIDDIGNAVHQAKTFQGQPTPTNEQLGVEPRFETAAIGGRPYRFLSAKMTVDGRVFTVQVAAPLQELERGLKEALWLLLLLFPAALLLAAAGGHWMSRRALAPVAEITETARAISADDLGKRLAVPPTRDELQRLSETLNEMIARLQSAFVKVSRFTADASHELRTPLAVMRTTAEVALRSGADREHRQALEQIVAEIQRMSHLVENMLLIANADSGHGQLHMTRVDLCAAARDACAEAAILAHEKGLQFDVRVPTDPLWVEGDQNGLRRLFLIFIDNAVKYTQRDGKCEVYVARRGSFVVGGVKDTGIGIAREDVARVFDRFYRVDRARSRQQGGAGLGLAIAQWLAAAHGGTIGVESELDRGSTFEIELPLLDEALPQHAGPRNRPVIESVS